MTTNIIAIDGSDLKCVECGNDKPEKFKTITTPDMLDGHIQGYTLSGITCMVCETSMGFERVKNSSWC
jgi:hypothetical protein